MRSKNTPGAIGGLGRFSWLGYRGPEGDDGCLRIYSLDFTRFPKAL